MITDNNKKLAQWAMDFALKNGCQAAKVVLYANSNTSFELRDAKTVSYTHLTLPTSDLV